MAAEDQESASRVGAASGQAERIAEEEKLRADCYGLLARLLRATPEAELLRTIAGIEGDDTPFGRALDELAKAAASASAEALDDEYLNLFVGVGSGELLPYASYYLTGFLNEKPLAKLRGDMAQLGIARADEVTEPEDHIASLCEIMAGLINGSFGAPADLAAQRSFFDKHLGQWAARFFQDLEEAKSAAFYVPVGRVGRLFMEIEAAAFGMLSDEGVRRPH
ncbi:MAG: molecular chaperone TorD family protein [Alphaproteobacteria bacterium]|nr:molecular chaperone TorD family protein [Alphaproteobacteria bacterium]